MAQEFCERFDAIERKLAGSYGSPGEDTPDARADIPALRRQTGHRGVSREAAATAGSCPRTPALC